eukprot:TRINITY_DN62703_c0_g1_i1.p1 TRINITY_DN62703_c0_g1~~TRINITY_DN62703_c0_g1_i1.p1  ORF type:complete len:265 (-),score=48.92 TRINITY_DN62703_c0_g1_i1:52-846(-)
MSLGLLTFNIWFSEYEMARRMHSIASIISKRSPDLIAVQEMTVAHWHECLTNPVFAQYSWSPVPKKERYFTLIGSKHPFSSSPVRKPFDASMMGRDLLYARVAPAALPALTFATSHLESLNYAEVRKQQMNDVFKTLGTLGGVVFCGDTNINEADDGKIVLPRPWVDAWAHLHPEDPGYTFDVDRNPMMAQFDGWARSNHARLRFDRFWVHLKKYQLASIELIDEAADEAGLWPSDHFGLFLTLAETASTDGNSEERKAACSTA